MTSKTLASHFKKILAKIMLFRAKFCIMMAYILQNYLLSEIEVKRVYAAVALFFNSISRSAIDQNRNIVQTL